MSTEASPQDPETRSASVSTQETMLSLRALAPEDGRPAAWVRMHTALTAGAGHGLFLLAVVTQGGRSLPGMRDLGGASLAPVVLWFLACVPLAAGSWLLRSKLQRWPLGRLRMVSWTLLGATVFAYAAYLTQLVG